MGTPEEIREKSIVRTSIIGIITNVMLAAFKAVIGLMSNSVAIVMDAVNNISDAASSLITIIGTKLAGREPDKKHPFGYGRIEYLSAMIISVIVLYAGITSTVKSAEKIIDPDVPDYSAASLVIIAVAVVVKIVLGRYQISAGKKANSASLVNSGQDAALDSVISAATLVAAAVYLLSGFSLEAWLGLVIAIVVVKAGFDMLRETVSQILGERNDPELAKSIKKTVTGFPGVLGAYDLVLNNYGPDSWNGTIHIEVSDTATTEETDGLIRSIQEAVYREHKIILTAVGVYFVNTKDAEISEARGKIADIVFSHEHLLQMHGFHMDKEKKILRFDVVISLDAKDRKAVYAAVCEDVKKAYPDYRIDMVMDTDFAEG
ncbi:MAG: cation diffusion facilitator family transporter [Lachnospiraceae bacterium]|nr:cation diffusion facilitator family transporter [Lachnospiraceae bacterium]